MGASSTMLRFSDRHAECAKTSRGLAAKTSAQRLSSVMTLEGPILRLLSLLIGSLWALALRKTQDRPDHVRLPVRRVGQSEGGMDAWREHPRRSGKKPRAAAQGSMVGVPAFGGEKSHGGTEGQKFPSQGAMDAGDLGMLRRVRSDHSGGKMGKNVLRGSSKLSIIPVQTIPEPGSTLSQPVRRAKIAEPQPPRTARGFDQWAMVLASPEDPAAGGGSMDDVLLRWDTLSLFRSLG
ncbi:hypothetical protein VTO42DRAFT_5029 [Malbranchea cinnamomea]